MIQQDKYFILSFSTILLSHFTSNSIYKSSINTVTSFTLQNKTSIEGQQAIDIHVSEIFFKVFVYHASKLNYQRTHFSLLFIGLPAGHCHASDNSFMLDKVPTTRYCEGQCTSLDNRRSATSAVFVHHIRKWNVSLAITSIVVSSPTTLQGAVCVVKLGSLHRRSCTQVGKDIAARVKYIGRFNVCGQILQNLTAKATLIHTPTLGHYCE
jgi:hypothetical protein